MTLVQSYRRRLLQEHSKEIIQRINQPAGIHQILDTTTYWLEPAEKRVKKDLSIVLASLCIVDLMIDKKQRFEEQRLSVVHLCEDNASAEEKIIAYSQVLRSSLIAWFIRTVV